jgi:O6-methylguanine-DNA--protein-cysteine methyltransferase
MEIRFTIGDSSLGKVLVAATDKGICSVSLRESETALEESLRAQFPKAEVRRDDQSLRPELDTVVARIAGKNPDRSLTLDLQGTEFQREVWNELLAIPPGSTRSYLDVAQAIKRPKATRAVAQALRRKSGGSGGAVPSCRDERRFARWLQRNAWCEEGATRGRRGRAVFGEPYLALSLLRYSLSFGPM